MNLRRSISMQSATTSRSGFTLIEMLVVIVIISIMAVIALPALKGLTKSNSMKAASRQLLDDLALARQKAINNRCTVYMVFVPPNFWTNAPTDNTSAFNSLSSSSRVDAVQLSLGQFNTYALYADHNIGDQPGQFSPRYLTKWKTLPDGVIIETNMFFRWMGASPIPDPELVSEPPFVPTPRVFPVRAFTNDLSFPFPHHEITNSTPVRFYLPYLAFDSQGRLISSSGVDQFIPLVRASLLPNRDLNQLPFIPGAADVIEMNYREPNSTNYLLVHIDWLTGRAKLEKPPLMP